MELRNSDYIALVLIIALLVISFLSGAFTSKMQLQDEIKHAQDFCSNMTQQLIGLDNPLSINTINDQNIDYGLYGIE